MTGRIRSSSRRRRPYSVGRRLTSMIFMLVLLAAMINHTRKPETWLWLTNDRAASQEDPGEVFAQVPQPEGAPAAPPVAAPAVMEQDEVLLPNPTDLDPEEWAAAEDDFRDIRDKVPLSVEEMSTYWRFFRWARAQKRADLFERSIKHPFFTQLYQDSRKYRGKLVTLKLHVRRVLSFDAPQNSAEVKKVYELWGVTDESRSHLYCVVTDWLPPGFPEGARVEADVQFTGYFMKVMGYQGSDAQRGAPLLIGKLKGYPLRQMPKRNPQLARQEFMQVMWIGVFGVCVIAALRFIPIPWPWKSKPAPREAVIKGSQQDIESWLANPPPLPTDTKPRPAPPPFTDDDTQA